MRMSLNWLASSLSPALSRVVSRRRTSLSDSSKSCRSTSRGSRFTLVPPTFRDGGAPSRPGKQEAATDLERVKGRSKLVARASRALKENGASCDSFTSKKLRCWSSLEEDFRIWLTVCIEPRLDSLHGEGVLRFAIDRLQPSAVPVLLAESGIEDPASLTVITAT